LNNNNKSNGIKDDSLNDLIKKSKVMNSSSILKTYNINNTSISLLANYSIENLKDYVYQNEYKSNFLIGKINNLEEIKSTNRCSGKCDVEVIGDLYEQYGAAIFCFIEGHYIFITIDNFNSKMEAFTDKIGLMPLYYSHQLGSTWLFNEAKIFAANEDSNLELKPFDELKLASLNHQSDFTAFKNVFKVPKGHSLIVLEDGRTSTTDKYFNIKPSYYTKKKVNHIPDLFTNILNNILENSIKYSVGSTEDPALLLSGGLDSSLITAITKKFASNLTTISVGTKYTNEFKWAKIVSDFVGTNHHELIIQDEQVINGIINSCFENEIFDGFSAEVQSPLYNLMQYVQKLNKNKVLTGYGADLLFGGIISQETDVNDVNKILIEQINRTKWTGEFSPFIAKKFNVDVEHPFWNSRLISYALSLDGSYKKNSKEVKLILREMASKFKYLPENVTWRKKVGINEAASINTIFSQFLGSKTKNDYTFKNIFIYNIFKQVFYEKKNLNSLDIKDIALKSVNHFNYRINKPLTVISNSDEVVNDDESLLKLEIKDKILILEFNRNKFNPISYSLRQILKKKLNEADLNDDIDAVVITGGEGKSFSVGGDFNEVKNLKTVDQVDKFIEDIFDFFITSLKFSKPIVAAIDYHAIGMGLELVMTCDMCIGTNRCSFSLPELKHGLSCTVGSLMVEHLYGRIINTKFIYECETLDAKKLLDMNFLKKIVEPGNLLDEALKTAKQLAKYPRNAFKNTKLSTNKRFIKCLENVIEDSKTAHRASILSGENEKHFKNILRDKY
jgi:carbapenam-3-carboxylate synthase